MALDLVNSSSAENLGDLTLAATKLLYDDEVPEHIIGVSLGLAVDDGELSLKVNAKRIPENNNGSACSDLSKAFSHAETRAHVQSLVEGLHAEGKLLGDIIEYVAKRLNGSEAGLLGSLNLGEVASASLRNLMDVDICKPTLLVVTTPFVGLEFDDEPVTAKPGGRLDPNCNRPRLWNLGYEKNRVFGWYSNYRHKAGDPIKREEHNYNMTLKIQGANGGTLPIIIDPGNNNGGTGRP